MDTAKSENFILNETTPFAQPLVEVDKSISSITSTTLSTKILRVQNASKTNSYMGCSRKVQVVPGKSMGHCEHFKLFYEKIESCASQWFLQVLVKYEKLQSKIDCIPPKYEETYQFLWSVIRLRQSHRRGDGLHILEQEYTYDVTNL